MLLVITEHCFCNISSCIFGSFRSTFLGADQSWILLNCFSYSIWVSSELYNVVDDCPAPREEVFELARHLVKKRFPDWFEADSSPAVADSMMEKRDEKRVSNARLKTELGVRLLYPSYKLGLESIIDQIDVSL